MKKIITIIILVSMGFIIKAQDPHFSQFYSSPIYLAPSFAGSTGEPRFVLNFRDQWPKVPGTFITYSVSADHYFSNINSGFAVYCLSDNAGQGKMITNNIGLAYSYKVKINRELFFQPGISAYYYSRTINYSSLSFADEFFNGEFMGSSSEVLPIDKVQHTDFALSALMYSSNFWFGINGDHLMAVSPVLSNDIEYLDLKISAFGGAKFDINRRTRNKYNEHIHAAANYRYQSNIHQLDIGAYYNRKPFILGLWYRGIPLANTYTNPDALIYLVGIKKNGFTFSYSYDMTLGKLISKTGGSHEISVIYQVKDRKPKSRKRKPIPCPQM